MKARFFLATVRRYPSGDFEIANVATSHGRIAAWYESTGALMAAEFQPSGTAVKRHSPAWRACEPLGRRYAVAGKGRTN
jgi:hypothetical protein